MSCRHARALMSLSLDGLASVEQEGQLEQHLAECPWCCRQWQAMLRVDAMLLVPDRVVAPAGFADGVMSRVEAMGVPARSSVVEGRWLAIIGGLLVLFCLSLASAAGLVVILGVDISPALSAGFDLLGVVGSVLGNAGELCRHLLESGLMALRAAASLELVLAALSVMTIFATLMGCYAALLVRYQRTVSGV
ncbi:MAG: zf-HC2 domain-containing protein [Chloroflexi bacterium]|nr:zf-HC2 domain-containing protein [Chloroflexota bacterium]